MSLPTKSLSLRTTALALLLAALPPLAGCGGGGGGSSTGTALTPTATTAVVTGQVQSAVGSGVSGDRVVLNLGQVPLAGAITDAQGRFGLIAPTLAISGSDTLTVFDAAGVLLATVPVVLTPGASVTLPPITVGPPPPPAGV